MIKETDYDTICRVSDELDDVLSSKLMPEISQNLGKPVDIMFPEFSVAFPAATRAFLDCWPVPVAAFYKHRGTWLSYLVSSRSDLNVFFNLRFVFEPVRGLEFDQEHAMLPVNLRELYRFFDSFTITPDPMLPTGWLNAPFKYSSRLDLEQFRVRCGMKKSQTKSFCQEVGSDQLVCWLLTEAGDALFLDEASSDQNVYHVRGGEFFDFKLLKGPGGKMDEYLAHYISGFPVSKFDFRG